MVACGPASCVTRTPLGLGYAITLRWVVLGRCPAGCAWYLPGWHVYALLRCQLSCSAALPAACSGLVDFAKFLILCRGTNDDGQPLIAVIFRGQGKRISQEERQQRNKKVLVYFQGKASADREVCRGQGLELGKMRNGGGNSRSAKEQA